VIFSLPSDGFQLQPERSQLLAQLVVQVTGDASTFVLLRCDDLLQQSPCALLGRGALFDFNLQRLVQSL